MRIAFLADAHSVHTLRWIRALAALGHEVAVWSDRKPDDASWPEEVPVHLIPRLARGKVNVGRLASRMRRQMRHFGPDLVHAHYVSRYGLFGALAGRRPLVLSVWGADVEVFPARHSWVTRPLLRWIFTRADAVTASSRYLADVTAQYTDHPVTVIPFGIDMNRFQPRPANHGPLRFIVNKALEPTYGVDVLLAALARLPRDLDYCGRILGEGSQQGALRQMAKTLGLAQRVHFIGRIAVDDLPGALAWADVGIYPSRRESFGVAALEMMAVGRAVIARRIGGLSEVVAEGRTGILVDGEDPDVWAGVLTDGVRHPEAYRAMGANGPQWVRTRYNFEDNVKSMVALYEKLR